MGSEENYQGKRSWLGILTLPLTVCDALHPHRENESLCEFVKRTITQGVAWT